MIETYEWVMVSANGGVVSKMTVRMAVDELINRGMCANRRQATRLLARSRTNPVELPETADCVRGVLTFTPGA